ncbi:MAG: gamma carbonic anhydrase family protein [Gammaproteobacteria bacterium]|jgi:carbonic anhydrase/acetyltransferase-like protein (isoleucine patch superfamily)|nr:gamma carbonic anhydrase family protein [Gammaproteobacteria bacterium]MCP4880571.1 gamma carbonic anhydrase family protein [Gammaproteobacteria bacterium]MDP6165217.1 gamma carbonic anhydrase family protein [Gammaproteobacteria bacterium]
MSIRPFKEQQPTIHDSVMVDPQATVIGAVSIAEDSSVWPQAVIRGDVHTISIGARTSIQDGCVLHVTHRGPYTSEGNALTIGDAVTVGHNATLHGCTIGNQVLIGIGSTVLDGAHIEDQVILAANSLVPPGKTLVSGFMYAGSPASQRRSLTEKELALFDYMASNYVSLKNTYLEA